MPGNELINFKELSEIKKVFKSGGVLFRYGLNKQRNG